MYMCVMISHTLAGYDFSDKKKNKHSVGLFGLCVLLVCVGDAFFFVTNAYRSVYSVVNTM